VDDASESIKITLYNVKLWRDDRISLDFSNVTPPEMHGKEGERKMEVTVSADFFHECLWSPTFVYAFTRDVKLPQSIGEPTTFKVGEDQTVTKP